MFSSAGYACGIPRSTAVAAVCATTWAAAHPCAAQSFHGLGMPPGFLSSKPTAVSADGTVVVGVLEGWTGDHPYRWTASGGTIELPMLPVWTTGAALALNADGSIMVGRGGSGTEPRAALWTMVGGAPAVQDLGVPPGEIWASAGSISADGSVVAGWSGFHGFRWTTAGGMQPIQQLAAFGMSADGSVLVGAALDWAGYWTSAAGRVVLYEPVPLPNGRVFATAASADGRVMVGGRASFGNFAGAVRWDIDPSTGQYTWRWLDMTECEASAISADGRVVAGSCMGAGGISRPVVWHDTLGVLDLTQYLTAVGINLTGWQLRAARAVSADGTVIVGWGVHAGTWASWLARLPQLASCYANCDNSTQPPILNVEDFTCFINAFAMGQSLPPAQQVGHYSNCDGSTISPVLNVEDFTCFINAFATGCR
jgi:uncharacterized membrane protein